MTQFKLKNKTVSEVRRVLKWALDNAEFSQSAILTAKDQDGMQQLITNPDRFDYNEVIDWIENSDLNTFSIQLKFEGHNCGKRLVFRIDVYHNGEINMMYLGLPGEKFDEIERQDILVKVVEHVEGYA